MPKKRYLIQESGQVTLPVEMRKQFNLQKGDEVLWEETETGWMVRPALAAIEQLADEIASELAQHGITAEDLMASGREERRQLLKELYDIDDET